MNRGFYPRLAWTGMKQNRRLYLPYLLTCTGVTAMFYILMGLSVSSVLPQMSGGRSTALIMSLGSVVIAFFALIFLFYTHSFLIRRRSREFGLYNVLGMGKGNIARVLLWETLLSCGATTLIGLALGILLSKLAEVALLNLLHLRVAYTFTVSIPSLLLTLGLFAAIHALIFLRSLWELHRVSAVALLRSESVGEKPPRARWALAVLGIALLGGAYWLAVSIREPLEALTWFFVAVIMVIVGTYLLFIAGSVALCRMLQKNPRYYYQPRHFVSVSSMAYRMKRNGAGLASICVLATMVLVMLSSTTWRVKSLLDRCTVNGAAAADVTPSLYVVVPDFDSAARLLLALSADSDLSVQLRWYYQFDSDLPDDAQHSGSASYGTDGVPANLTDALQMALYSVNAETDLTTGWEVESLAANRSDFYGAYGGLFYLGIMLSAVFSLAAVSIIYYKQVCEGYEDQSRFAIMQKVGMTKQDIRRSINSQLLTVFFLPMALSGVHLCFAFPFIHKLLLLFNLSNTSLLIGTTVVCYVAFALLYTLAYKLTSNAYYHIVSGAAERE